LALKLSSKLESVRSEARKTVFQIAGSVDRSYLPFIVKELKQLLTKGYQVRTKQT